MTYKFESKGKKIEFEEGEFYYISDWYITRVKGELHQFPILVKSICIETDPDDWDYEFQLKEIENIIYSDYPAKSYNHPGNIMVDEWDDYFQDSMQTAYDRFYNEYKEDPKRFFNRIFEAFNEKK